MHSYINIFLSPKKAKIAPLTVVIETVDIRKTICPKPLLICSIFAIITRVCAYIAQTPQKAIGGRNVIRKF